jgi:hypothetical protein
MSLRGGEVELLSSLPGRGLTVFADELFSRLELTYYEIETTETSN